MVRARNAGRRRHPIIAAMWLAAAGAIGAGFVMRILATFWIGFGLRLLGVELMATGVVLAGLGWLAERMAGLGPR